MGGILNKLHLAQPMARDDKERLPCIPESVRHKVKFDKEDPNRPKLERDIEVENGGAGVFNVDLKSKTINLWVELYMLKSDEWKYDVIPEIMDGKNVADFIGITLILYYRP